MQMAAESERVTDVLLARRVAFGDLTSSASERVLQTPEAGTSCDVSPSLGPRGMSNAPFSQRRLGVSTASRAIIATLAAANTAPVRGAADEARDVEGCRALALFSALMLNEELGRRRCLAKVRVKDVDVAESDDKRELSFSTSYDSLRYQLSLKGAALAFA